MTFESMLTAPPIEAVPGDPQREAVRLREAQSISHVGSWHCDLHTGAVNWSHEMFLV